MTNFTLKSSLSCFYFLAVRSYAHRNIHMHGFAWQPVSALEYSPRSGISGSW